MNAVGWVCVGMVGGFIFSIIMYVISLTSRRSDFETDDLEWESGNVNVKAYNKAQHDIDTDRVRDNYENESG